MSMIPQQPAPNQGAGSSDLLQELQSEVTHEAAPLLQFLLKHAVTIMVLLGLFALALGGMGAYTWHAGKSAAEAQDALARIMITTQGAARVDALEKFVEQAPDGLRVAALMELADAAMREKAYAKAAATYEKAAAADAEGAVGLLASFNHGQALLADGKAEAALSVLNALLPRLEENAARQVLPVQAAAALAAKKPELALKSFETLAAKAQGAEKEYLESRVLALREQLKK